MILVFTRQPEMGARVTSYIQGKLGWRAVACGRRQTMDLPTWRYHLDALTGGGDSIIYGWTLLNVLIEEKPNLPPNYIRRWCREFLVRGGVIFHVEPTLPELIPGSEGAFGLSERELSELGDKERELQKLYYEFLASFQGLPASMVLSLEEGELMLRVREADAFFQRARRYEGRGHGCGSLVPRIVFVGGSTSPHDPSTPPFGMLGGSSAYLGDLLDAFGLQEGELHFLNTTDLKGEPTDHSVLGLLRPEVLVLLGRRAAIWWNERQPGAEDQLRVIYLEHPWHLKSFHFDELNEHARRLKSALERAHFGERVVDARLVPESPLDGDDDESEVADYRSS